MAEKEIFDRLYSLIEKHEECCSNYKIAVDTNDFERMMAAERLGDKVYSIFFETVQSGFERKILEEVEMKIGKDKFITMLFVDTLKEVYENTPIRIQEYKGYTLEKTLDERYFVCQDDRKYWESIEYANDERAIKHFKWCIDKSPNNPDFEM